MSTPMILAGGSLTGLEELAGQLRGEVLPPHTEYERQRRVYNAAIDRHPACIVRCADAGDVIGALRFAGEHELPVAVRAGGHSGAGFGVIDAGVVIDLSPMRGVRVDPRARTARIDGGALLSDLDHASHAFGLATPTGIVSSVGVAGLTLGGGHGYLTRLFGLTIDNLLEADVVLADGSFVTASPDHEPDLFWALRGGGGNFGVVTSLVLQLHPVSTVVAGPTFYNFDRAGEVLAWYRDFIAEGPDQLYGFFAFLTVPPAPQFPAELHLRRMCGIVWCYAGPPERADDVLAPVRSFGPPALYGLQPMPYPALQSMFDALYPAGLHWYWRADLLLEITDTAIQAHLEHASAMPTLHSTVHLYPIDGAAHSVRSDETAFAHRNARWSMMIAGVDPFAANASRLRDWAVNYWEAIHPHSVGAAYVNFLMDESPDRVRASYGDNYRRLAELKARYDPTNRFRHNQNISPA